MASTLSEKLLASSALTEGRCSICIKIDIP
jgi:hypothetical protein